MLSPPLVPPCPPCLGGFLGGLFGGRLTYPSPTSGASNGFISREDDAKAIPYFLCQPWGSLPGRSWAKSCFEFHHAIIACERYHQEDCQLMLRYHPTFSLSHCRMLLTLTGIVHDLDQLYIDGSERGTLREVKALDQYLHMFSCKV